VNSNYEEIHYNSVAVNPVDHTRLTAHYRLNVPLLDVPDTLYATWSQTSLDVPVHNGNFTEHLAMDWFSETGSDWFTIKEGTDTGKEDGTITLELSSNEGDQRTGTLRVYAFDASNPEREVVIMQGSRETGIRRPGLPAGSSLVIYPVPASEEIRIDLPDDAIGKHCHISIFTMDGRKIYSQDWIPEHSTEHNIGLSGFNPGVFVMKAVIGDITYRQKFIKQ
jgi:hypothetical protein